MSKKGLLTYAFNSNGNFVHIDEVPKGLACDCYCPSCKEKYVAKMVESNVSITLLMPLEWIVRLPMKPCYIS